MCGVPTSHMFRCGAVSCTLAIVDWQPSCARLARVEHHDADFCVTTLKDAMSRYGVTEMFNTDQGSQLTSYEFTKTLWEGRSTHFNGWPRPLDG